MTAPGDRQQGRFGVVQAAVMDDPRITHAAFRLYCILTSYADTTGECWPANGTLADRLGTDVRNVRRYLSQLSDAGLISKVERSGDSNRYFIPLNVPSPPKHETRKNTGKRVNATGSKLPRVKTTLGSPLPHPPGSRRPSKHTKEHTIKTPPLPSGVTPKGGKPAQASLIPLPEAPPAKAAKAPDLFPEFWKAYPKKIAKGRAEPAYRRALRHATHDQIMDGVARVTATWEANGTPPQYRKAPEAWLNGKCWEDEQYLDGPSRPAFPRYETSGDVAVRVARDLMNPHSSTTVIPFPYATGAFDDEDDGREVLEGTHHRVPDQTASRL